MLSRHFLFLFLLVLFRLLYCITTGLACIRSAFHFDKFCTQADHFFFNRRSCIQYFNHGP